MVECDRIGKSYLLQTQGETHMPTIGEKIKGARLDLGLTQSELCGDFMTRNMLSQIESGKAHPSLGTLEYLAEKLGIPTGYFTDADATLSEYKKRESMPKIKKLLSGHSYQKCIDLCKKLEGDDEIYLIISKCYLEIGNMHYTDGWLEGARKAYVLADDAASKTIYPTEGIVSSARAHLEIIDALTNSRTPDVMSAIGSEGSRLSELAAYSEMLSLIEKSKYEVATGVYDALSLKDPLFRIHINARLSMSAGNYNRAISLLQELIDRFDDNRANAPFRYSVLADLEISCKSIGDYKGAYEYAEKRRALSDKFGIRMNNVST